MNCLDALTKSLIKFEEKELCLKVVEAFGKNAYSFDEHNQIARLFYEFKDYNNAIFYAKKSLSLCKTKEHRNITRQNLINSYNKNNLPEKALEEFEKLETITSELLIEKSFSYALLNEYEESSNILLKIKDDPSLDKKNRGRLYHNLAKLYFEKDDIHKGLEHFIPGGEEEAYKSIETPNCKKWDGKVLKGKHILIDNACGAGDEIISIRFIKHIKNLGMNPIWATVRKDLKEIFEYNDFDKIVIRSPKKPLPQGTEWVYSLSLPYYLNLSANDLWDGPYLKPIKDKDKKYSYLNRDKKFKIGVFWNSTSGFEQAHMREIDPKPLLESILESKVDSSLYSLQLSDVPVPSEYKKVVKTFYKERDFTDTFSIISKMDLVITSCTSIAHIAASMGKEVCVLVPIIAYHVWESSTGKSWWYGDNVHIFKQKKPRDWEEPINELKNFLKNK